MLPTPQIPELILFEDKNIIAVNKPAKLNVTAPQKEAQPYLEKMISQYINEKPVYAVHRLDFDTSGVVIFAKNKPTLTQLHEAFQNHRVKKTYQAICTKTPNMKVQKSWVVENELARIKTSNGHIYYASQEHIKKNKLEKISEYKKSYTHFQKIKENDTLIWVECHPKTGRTHQLRVHLSELGLPILGDPTYAPSTTTERMFLHAEKLVMNIKPALELQAPIPSEFLQIRF